MVFNKNYDQALGARGHVAKIVFNIGVQSTQAVLKIQAGQLDFQTSNLADRRHPEGQPRPGAGQPGARARPGRR